MRSLRHLCFAAFALAAGFVPAAAYTGYYAPVCGWSTVWMLSGYHYQYVCF